MVFLDYIAQHLHHIQGFISGSLMANICGKDESKYLYQEKVGEQCVLMAGMILMLELLVDN